MKLPCSDCGFAYPLHSVTETNECPRPPSPPIDSEPEELEAWIGKWIMGLEGVGYWRRESMMNTKWIPCSRGDKIPDFGSTNSGAYHLYYLPDSKEDEPHPRSLPEYTRRVEDAIGVVACVWAQGIHIDIHFGEPGYIRVVASRPGAKTGEIIVEKKSLARSLCEVCAQVAELNWLRDGGKS